MVPWAASRAPIRKSDWFDPPRANALAPTQEMARGWGRNPSGVLGGAPKVGGKASGTQGVSAGPKGALSQAGGRDQWRGGSVGLVMSVTPKCNDARPRHPSDHHTMEAAP